MSMCDPFVYTALMPKETQVEFFARMQQPFLSNQLNPSKPCTAMVRICVLIVYG